MVKKLNGFLMGKNLVFQNNTWKISKTLKFCGLRKIFSIFLRFMFYTGNTTGKERITQSYGNSKALSFTTRLRKNENSLSVFY